MQKYRLVKCIIFKDNKMDLVMGLRLQDYLRHKNNCRNDIIHRFLSMSYNENCKVQHASMNGKERIFSLHITFAYQFCILNAYNIFYIQILVTKNLSR